MYEELITILDADKKQCPNPECQSQDVLPWGILITGGSSSDTSIEKTKYTIYECIECKTRFKIKEA